MSEASEQWKIAVDHGRCVGTGACVAAAPGRFVLDARFQSTPVDETVPADQSVLDALELCPVEAIAVTDAATGKPVEPD